MIFMAALAGEALCAAGGEPGEAGAEEGAPGGCPREEGCDGPEGPPVQKQALAGRGAGGGTLPAQHQV